jgi:hypothetical protein
MPTKTEREYYAAGYRDGRRAADVGVSQFAEIPPVYGDLPKRNRSPKRKLSAWNKYVKANSKKPRFRLRSGSPNLKKLAVAFRKTPAGKKKRR